MHYPQPEKYAERIVKTSTMPFDRGVPTPCCIKTCPDEPSVRHLTPAHGRDFATACVVQTRWGTNQPEHKNAGGHPPALGESPNWETQVDYTAAPCELLETLLPELLEKVLLEIAESAKECRIGLSLQMPFELQVGQLDAANAVSNLGKTIAACNGILIDNRLAGDARCNRPMNRFGHNALPAVVVNLDGIKLLQIGEMIEQENLEVFLYDIREGLRSESLLLVINEDPVLHRKVLNKNPKSMQVLFAHLNVLPSVFIISVNQRIEMERRSVKIAILNRSFMQPYIVPNIEFLLMKHKPHEIEIGDNSNVSRLVYENRQLFHIPLPAAACRDIKNAGGNPPALGGPPIRRIHLLYTTNQNVYSILSKVEHMLYTIDSNICSPYGKAA